MPILRPHATQYIANVSKFHKWCISCVKFTSVHLNVYMRVGMARALASSSNFELLGEQSSQKFVIPCLGSRRTAEQNVTPLALSSVEESVSIQSQTQKNTQKTANDISTPSLSACVDNKKIEIHIPCFFRFLLFSTHYATRYNVQKRLQITQKCARSANLRTVFN